MASNKQAMKRIRRAILDLMTVRDRSNVTNAQKDRIKASIRALEDEYLALAGVNPDTTYAEITQKLSSAKQALDKIVEERNQLANALTSAAKIFGSINSVLKLIQ